MGALTRVRKTCDFESCESFGAESHKNLQTECCYLSKSNLQLNYNYNAKLLQAQVENEKV